MYSTSLIDNYALNWGPIDLTHFVKSNEIIVQYRLMQMTYKYNNNDLHLSNVWLSNLKL